MIHHLFAKLLPEMLPAEAKNSRLENMKAPAPLPFIAIHLSNSLFSCQAATRQAAPPLIHPKIAGLGLRSLKSTRGGWRDG